jgi:hypothetical protein
MSGTAVAKSIRNGSTLIDQPAGSDYLGTMPCRSETDFDPTKAKQNQCIGRCASGPVLIAFAALHEAAFACQGCGLHSQFRLNLSARPP